MFSVPVSASDWLAIAKKIPSDPSAPAGPVTPSEPLGIVKSRTPVVESYDEVASVPASPVATFTVCTPCADWAITLPFESKARVLLALLVFAGNVSVASSS